MDIAQFHGTRAEALALEVAVEHNCTCKESGGPACCAAHRAMLDQRYLDFLLFFRHIAERLRAEEAGQSRFRPGKTCA